MNRDELNAIVRDVTYKDWWFHIGSMRDGFFVQARFFDQDENEWGMTRSVTETVDAMISVVPDGEELKRELIVFKQSIFLELPEGNTNLWRQLASILNARIPNDQNEWQEGVFQIWKGEGGPEELSELGKVDEVSLLRSRVSAYESLLRRFVELWSGVNTHYESHYRAVAKHHMTTHHCNAMYLLDEVRAILRSAERSGGTTA